MKAYIAYIKVSTVEEFILLYRHSRSVRLIGTHSIRAHNIDTIAHKRETSDKLGINSEKDA